MLENYSQKQSGAIDFSWTRELDSPDSKILSNHEGCEAHEV
jgi:hypothetical protein